MRAAGDVTSILVAPYTVVYREGDRPWLVMHCSGEAHNRATVAGMYVSEETATDAAEALNELRRLLNMHF